MRVQAIVSPKPIGKQLVTSISGELPDGFLNLTRQEILVILKREWGLRNQLESSIFSIRTEPQNPLHNHIISIVIWTTLTTRCHNSAKQNSPGKRKC